MRFSISNRTNKFLLLASSVTLLFLLISIIGDLTIVSAADDNECGCPDPKERSRCNEDFTMVITEHYFCEDGECKMQEFSSVCADSSYCDDNELVYVESVCVAPEYGVAYCDLKETRTSCGSNARCIVDKCIKEQDYEDYDCKGDNIIKRIGVCYDANEDGDCRDPGEVDIEREVFVKDCNDYNGWYCSGETGQEYRDYTCKAGSCTSYEVTDTRSCPSSAPFCCNSDNACHQCCKTDDCHEIFGLNYFCNSITNQCQCSPEDKEELGAECGPNGCDPQGFGLCDSGKECVGNFCVDKKDFRTIVGYLKVIGHNDKEILVELIPYDSYQESTAGQYCSKLNEWFFGNQKCKGKGYNECGGIPGNDDIVNFQVSNYELKDQSVIINCNQRGPIDGWCDGSSSTPDSLTIKLCDPKSNVPCDSSTYHINLEKLGLDINCVYLDEEKESDKNCESESKLILRAANNYETCDDSGEDVCIMGRCVKYVCYHNNRIDGSESCDPVAPQTYNASGTIVTEDDITCSLLWMNPKDNDLSLKPSCLKSCVINTRNCEQLSSLCGNYKLDSKENYDELCDIREEPLITKYLNGNEIEITAQFKDKHSCAEKEGYIGDASLLSCKGCLAIDYENCEQEAISGEDKTEKTCNDGLNEDYWYDLFIPEGADRSEYIIDNYLNEFGYFDKEKLKFDTSKCFNETNCFDCYDIDCDGKEAIDGKLCNFKTERMCNDNFDNDGDGLIDSEDNDCNSEGYNPELSLKGFCSSTKQCFDDDFNECLPEGYKQSVNNKIVICSAGRWISAIKAEANLLYENAINKQKFTLYCNDFGDAFEDNQGYVISLESKLPSGDVQVGDFMKSYGSFYGKFCAFKSNEDYAISTRIKGLENDPSRLAFAMQLFSTNPSCCNGINDDSTTKISKCDENISINKKYGIVIKTNEDIDGKELLKTEAINEKIKALKDYLSIIGINNFASDNLWRGSLTEALAWKKSGEKELFGIVENINGTIYAVVLLTNVGTSFEDSCSIINSEQTIKIGENLAGICQNVNDDDFIIHWAIHKEVPNKENLIKISLDRFDTLVKSIKIN